jgi:hypothetical protein
MLRAYNADSQHGALVELSNWIGGDDDENSVLLSKGGLRVNDATYFSQADRAVNLLEAWMQDLQETARVQSIRPDLRPGMTVMVWFAAPGDDEELTIDWVVDRTLPNGNVRVRYGNQLVRDLTVIELIRAQRGQK